MVEWETRRVSPDLGQSRWNGGHGVSSPAEDKVRQGDWMISLLPLLVAREKQISKVETEKQHA